MLLPSSNVLPNLVSSEERREAAVFKLHSTVADHSTSPCSREHGVVFSGIVHRSLSIGGTLYSKVSKQQKKLRRGWFIPHNSLDVQLWSGVICCVRTRMRTLMRTENCPHQESCRVTERAQSSAVPHWNPASHNRHLATQCLRLRRAACLPGAWVPAVKFYFHGLPKFKSSRSLC